MQAFQLDLPRCQTEKETFSGQTSWPGPSLVLSFKAPKDCVNQYLKDHEADVTNPIQWPGSAESTMGDVELSPTRPPFEDASMKQFHLELDPGKKYEIFTGFRTRWSTGPTLPPSLGSALSPLSASRSPDTA
ncbi:hypothetical protein ABZY31_30520 [Streptomyces sp. NPDC006529]|uniref:hypothetical protein n=1 Tax=Streptomyces sp. NPDC006529 TaxID=3157177 RepID=UPI0033B10BDB